MCEEVLAIIERTLLAKCYVGVASLFPLLELLNSLHNANAFHWVGRIHQIKIFIGMNGQGAIK